MKNPWSAFVLANDLPRPPGTRAVNAHKEELQRPLEPPPKRRARSTTALQSARSKAEWTTTLVRVYGPQCTDCMEGKGECERHSFDGEQLWWQRGCRGEITPDGGLEELLEAARRAEAERLTEVDGAWRQEWSRMRVEQLRLQGEAHLATADRLLPGRSDDASEPSQAYPCHDFPVSCRLVTGSLPKCHLALLTAGPSPLTPCRRPTAPRSAASSVRGGSEGGPRRTRCSRAACVAPWRARARMWRLCVPTARVRTRRLPDRVTGAMGLVERGAGCRGRTALTMATMS